MNKIKPITWYGNGALKKISSKPVSPDVACSVLSNAHDGETNDVN